MKFKSCTPIMVAFALVVPLKISISHAQVPTTVEPTKTAPRVFDRAYVTLLINDIENPLSRKKLLDKYFMFAPSDGLPVPEGSQLLADAIAQEKVGTKKWLLMEKVLGYATLQTTHENTLRPFGFKAYDEIISQQDLLLRIGFGPILGEVVTDFADAMAFPPAYVWGQPDELGLRSKFFNLHLKLLRRGIYTSLGSRWPDYLGDSLPKLPDWASAAITDPNNKNSFGILRFASIVQEWAGPQLALPTLEKMKPLVAGRDRDQVISYYRSLIRVNEQLDKLPEAISAAREMVSSIKIGRADLIRLLLKTDDYDSLLPVVQSYETSVSADEEIEPLLGAINNPYLKNANQTATLRRRWLIRILVSYLSSKQKRNIDRELQASSFLYSFYVEEGNSSEAQQLMENILRKPRPTSRIARSFYDTMQWQRDKLNSPTKPQ